jgi:alanine-synthesizing transaminase
MLLRRVDSLPPYLFARVRELTLQLRGAGIDVVDLGFGNPDIPSPGIAVTKLAEAAAKPANHRYSRSRGLPNLLAACSEHYLRSFGVVLEATEQVVHTIGAKEGLAHLMWLLLEPGDVALVPTPSYPIHQQAPALAGAAVESFQVASEPHIAELEEAYDRALARHRVKPRLLLISFPHNPTTATVDELFMRDVVNFARERGVAVVHDFAYAEIAFDGYRPPSILQVPGANNCCVELYTLTKGFSMAGWRVGFAVGNSQLVNGLAKLKSWLDYGTFQPIQIAAITALREAVDYPAQVCEVYRRRRDTLCQGLTRIGWPVSPPRGTMFVWAPIPDAFRELGSIRFSELLVREAGVAVSPGAGFGPEGEGYVRFALVENEQRIRQAVRGIRALFARQHKRSVAGTTPI